MAKKWEEVASNPEYQNLSSSEKEDVRKEYFENVVKPNVPSEDLAKAQKDFDQFSNPSAARKAINAIKSGVTLFKDAAYDAIDNRTLSEKGLLTSKESDENAMSRKVPGVPLRVDYFDKLKQQDRIAPKSIDAMAGTKGATARAADTVIAERPFNADVNQGTNDAIYGEPQKQIPFDERKREERRLEAEAKAKLFTESLKQAGETRSADQALQQAVNKKPSQEEVTNVANQIAHKEEMQAMYGDIPKPEGMDVATNAAGRAVKTGSALAQNMIAFGSSVVNADDLALKFLQSAAKTQDEAGQYPAALKDFTEIQSWSDVPTYALEGVIENAPMLVGSIGSGALGAFTAKNLGKNKLAKLTQEAAVKELAKRATIGATVGAGTASIGMESGSIFGDIYRETGEQRTALAAAGGIVAGAFDAIPAVMALKTALGGKVGEEAAKTIIKRYGVDGLKQIGAEGGTEFAQTWVEEIAKARASGNDVLSQQNLINSLDAMFKGGAAGGVTHIAAQGFNDLTAKKVEKFKTLPNENLQRLRATAEKAMPQDVPLIDAEIQRRANTPTLQRAVEAGMREGGITQPAETLPASDILENENDGISDATSILATETDGLGLDNTEGSRGDIPETTGSGTVSDWIIDSTRPLEQGDGGDLSVRGNDSEGKPDVTLNDVTAHAAATSDLNDTPQPTEAQKEAGNYKKGSVKISGMDISVENPHTSTRSGVDKDGTAWENQQNGHYGYIKGVVARSPDKEHVDVNVKPNTAEDYAGDVFVINQNHPGTGKFDEPKVYIGYGSKDEAEAAYRSNYADGWNGLDSVAQIPMEQFKEMLNDEKAFLKPVELKKQENEVLTPIETIDVFKEKGRAVSNKIDLAQNKDGKWVAGYSFQDDKNSYNGGGRAAQLSDIGFDTKEEAISDVAAKIAEFIKTPSLKSAWQKHIKQLEGKENGLQKQGQKTAQKINKQTPKVNSLLSKIFNLGGITSNDKLDVTGQDKSFAPGGYNKIFNKQSNQSLRGLIENGDLDEFLPHNMRVSSITQDSDAYDSAEAYDYLADKIRAGEKVLPYEAQQEIEQNKYQEDLTAEEHVDLVAETLTEDQINEQFRIAANEEREASILATDFIPDNEDGVIESSQREAIGKQTEPQTVTSQEREGVRPIVEAIAKRRAAANQINKAKAFDANLQLAKDFMAGKDVKPVKFTTAATLFNKDSALNESFNKLATMAKAPAKEARAEKDNIVESYKQRIAESKTQDALQTIAGEIQRDSALSDTQAQALDDIVFDAQDKLEVNKSPTNEVDDNKTENINYKRNIWIPDMKKSKLDKLLNKENLSKNDIEDLENFKYFLINDKQSAQEKGFYNILQTSGQKETAYSLKNPFLLTNIDNKLNEAKNNTATTEPNKTTDNTDLLGDNTAAKQAIADVERAKDAKRNEGISDTEGFTLTGSNSEADKAAAAGAQDLFAMPNLATNEKTNSLSRDSSWVIRDKETGEVIQETFQKSVADKVNTEKYEAVPILQHLQEMNESDSKVRKYALQNNKAKDEVTSAKKEPDTKSEPKPESVTKPKTPLDDFDNAMDEYNKGIANADDYKKAFESVLANEQPIKDYLEANFTKQQLFDRAGGYFESRYKSEKKSRVVDALYSDMVSDFLLPNENGMTSYSANYGEDRHKGIKSQVDAITQDTLDKAMDRRKQAIEKNNEAKAERLKGIDDPKTLDDYTALLRSKIADGMTLKDARLSLTPEQRETYDRLYADKTIADRAGRKEAQQSNIQTAGQTVDGTIIETKHTQKGHDLFVVQLAERVSKEDYTTLNAGAKKLGGYYSSFRGRDAVPGFQFTSKENAQAFVQLAGGDTSAAKEQVKERRNAFEDDKSQSAVERLTEMANKLEDKADEDLGRERKSNTSRRAGMAARAEANANAEKAMAITMRNIAQAIESGSTKYLGKVRQKVQVELLQSITSAAQYTKLREQYPSYGDYEKHQHEAPTKDTADYAEFPTYTLYRSDLASLGRKMVDIEGLKILGNRILSVANDVTDAYLKFAKDNIDKVSNYRDANGQRAVFSSKSLAEQAIARSGFNGKAIVLPFKRGENLIIDSPSASKERGVWMGDDDKKITLSADFGKELVEKIGKANRRTNKLNMPWQFENAYDKREKLARMGIENPAEMRAALREFIGLKEQVKQPDKIKELERKMIGRRNDGLDFFPTPVSTADEMIESADIKEGMTVLEPSAGMGHIAERIRDAGFEPDVVEFNDDRRELLEVKGFNVVGSDFLGITDKYDRIIMNPPFSNRRDEEHVRHAYSLLKPNGKLVAIMGEGVFFGSDKRATEFREWLESVKGTSEKLEEGTFKDASLPVNTSVNARMVVIQKETDDGNVVMFSRSKSTQQIYENRIDDLFADGKADFKGTGVKVLDKSDMLNLLGYGDKPVYLSENKVQQGKYNHGLTAEHWKKIPEWLDDPALVFDSDTVTGRLVFIAPELLNGAPIRIIVDPDATANGLKINLVVNAYDAKGKLPFGRWVKDGLLRFYSKAKSLAILARSGLQLSSMAKARSSNGRIYQDSDLVNYKNEDKTNFSRSDAKLPAMREKIMGGLPLFAQGNKKVGMPIADVEKEVKNFSKGWKRIPQVIVVDSMQDERINEHVRNTNKQMIENGATGLPIGFISQGKVYILAPMVNNKSDIATVMMHEIFGHAGLRANFGAKLDDILEQIYITRRKEVMAKAKQYGYDFTKHSDRLKAAEEVLAEMAQNNPQLGFVKRAIAAIRAWLRANIPYYKNLEITDEDIIGNILIPARNFILKGKTGGSDLGLKKVTPVFSRTNQIKSATGNNGDFDSNNNDIRFSRQGNITPEWDAPEASKIDSLIYTLQDKHIDLKRVTENIKNVGNHIDDRWNAYLQEELYHGRAAKRTQDFIKHELEPLIKDMQERKVTMADFEEYLWMRHAPERNKKMASINEGSPDGLAGVSTKDAKEYLANLTDQQKLDFEALAERIDAINKASEQVLIDYGLESTDTIAKWNSTYKHYVPLMREDMENGSGNGTGQGFSVKGNASKRATGSKRAVVDILANIAQQREKYIIRGEKNRVSTALIGLAKLNPNDEFWKTDTPPTITAVSKATGMVETYTDPNYKNRDNVIVARIPDKLGKIQERSVIFNEFDDRAMRMARSLKNLDQDQLHEVLGTASIITRYFSSINTQYNPIFGVINLLRDTQTAAINLSSTPLKGKQKEVMSHVLPALIGIYSDLRSERESGTMPTNEYAILFEEFQKEGGQTGYRDMYRNAKERSAAIEHALDHEWWTKTKIGKAISANGKFAAAEVWMNDKAVKPIFNWLSDYNEAMENAVRLSAYKVAIDNGLSKQQAASIAKNISVNFNRKGEMGRQIGSLYAFFNASVQGTARIADTLLKNDDGKYSLSKTGKTIVKGGLLLGVMQALLLAAAGYSDDDPPAYSKDRNLIIPLDIFGADNKYATIALPLGFNAIPAFSRHITEWALSGGEDTHDRVIQIIDMILNVTNPIGNAGLSLQTALPTLADPLAAIAENKDFTGRDISRKDFNQLDPTPGFTRSRDKAWDVSIAVARAMNWASGGTDYQPGWASPTADQIEYLAGQVTGGVGREIIKAGTTVDALISGEDLPSYKIPLLGRFYGDAASQSSQGAKFYKNITELNKIENELKGRAKNHEDVNSFKENNPEYRAIVTARISLEQVQNLRKRQRAMVEKGEDKEKIKDIDEKITMIMTRLNTKVEDYRSQASE